MFAIIFQSKDSVLVEEGQRKCLTWCKSDLLPKSIQLKDPLGFYENGITKLCTKVKI
jgi:hypothetical protein